MRFCGHVCGVPAFPCAVPFIRSTRRRPSAYTTRDHEYVRCKRVSSFITDAPRCARTARNSKARPAARGPRPPHCYFERCIGCTIIQLSNRLPHRWRWRVFVVVCAPRQNLACLRCTTFIFTPTHLQKSSHSQRNHAPPKGGKKTWTPGRSPSDDQPADSNERACHCCARYHGPRAASAHGGHQAARTP